MGLVGRLLKMPKKNNVPQSDAVGVDEELLRKAKLALQSDRPAATARCTICASDAAPNSTESLCWVCRRLKISAWRDSDQQVTAQE
jgi:hypothetical protein